MGYLVIVHASNDERDYIARARYEAAIHFARKQPKVVVRNADAYDPKQHENADAIVTSADRELIIRNYDERGSEILIVRREAAFEGDQGEGASSAGGVLATSIRIADFSVHDLKALLPDITSVQQLQDAIVAESQAEGPRTTVIKMLEKRIRELSAPPDSSDPAADAQAGTQASAASE